MDLLTLLLRLPFLPLTGLLRIADIIREEADRQLHDPSRVRRELEEAQQQEAAGVISEDELSRIEYAATRRIVGEPTPAAEQAADREAASGRAIRKRRQTLADRRGAIVTRRRPPGRKTGGEQDA